MKIFFSLETLDGLDSILDDRFGRARFIMIYNTEDQKIIHSEANPFAAQDHGVGVSVANFIIQQACDAAVGNRFGPKAGDILKTAGIKMVDANRSGKETVKNVVHRL